ncbi:uncharacterized protein LOC135497923 isoform X2 [Lineus longissimus]|uniref:uncharacterized protein LOC135497923 isoform X2 n=1 Tax=Lineus longissimus TaxID=88925 RepID=UPI00315DD198
MTSIFKMKFELSFSRNMCRVALVTIGLWVIQLSAVAAVPPALASDLTVDTFTTTGVTVKWTLTTGTFDNFKVTFTPAAGGAATDTQTPAKTAIQAVTTALQAGTAYTARVVTVLGGVEGPAKTKTFTTLPPALTSDLTVDTFTTTGVTVKWTLTTGSFTNFKVTFTPTAGGAVTDTLTPAKTAIQAVTIALQAGTAYTARVVTVLGGVEGPAKTKTFSTLPPALTSDLTVDTFTTTGVTVKWTLTTGSFTNFKVTFTPTAGGSVTDTLTPAKTAIQAVTIALQAGTAYTARVVTVLGGVEGPAKTKTFTTLPPALTSDLTVDTFTTTGVTVKWTLTTGSFTNFKVTFTPTAGGAVTDTLTPAKTAIQAVTTALQAGTAYTARVVTVLGGVEGPAKTKTFTTLPPALTSDLTVDTFTTTGVTVKWTLTTGSFTNFKVTFTPTAGGAVTDTLTPAKTAIQAVTAALQAGTAYTARVVTVLGGVEGPAKTKTFTTLPPALTSDLTVDTFTTTGVTVKWTLTTGTFDTFKVTFAPTAGGAVIGTQTPAKTAIQAVTTALQAGTAYTARVVTVLGGVEGPAKTKTFTTLPPALTSDLTVDTFTTTGVTVKWTLTTGSFTNFKVTFTPTAGGAVTDTLTPAKTAIQAVTTALQAGTAYTARVVTVLGGVEGPAKTKTFTTLPPALTSDLTVDTFTTTGVTVKWTPTTGTFDTFKVTFAPTAGGAVLGTQTPAKTAIQAVTTALQAGTAYTARVVTVLGGVEGPAKTKTFTTLPPDIPADLTISLITATTAKVEWTKPSPGTFTSYDITISPTDNGATVDSPSVLQSVDPPTTTLSSLTPNVQYSVVVRTVVGTTKGATKTKSFTTLPPDIAVDLTISLITPNGATVEWTKPSPGPFTSYDISISPTANGAKVDTPSVLQSVIPPKTTLSSLTPGTLYTVTVQTVAGTTKGVAKTKTFTTLPPALASDLTVDAFTTTGVTVKWTTTTGSFDSLKVAFTPTAGGAVLGSQTLAKTATQAVTTALQAGTAYTARVVTVLGGVEGPAKTKTFTTAPNKPTITKQKLLVGDYAITGSTVTLTCKALGVVVSYEWYKGTVKQSSTGNKGADFSTQMTVDGEYSCKAINTGGSTESDKLTIKVVGPCDPLISLCKNGATCAVDPNDATKPKCTCKPGWEGPTSCSVDINECIDPASCNADAACTNTPGSFSCACKPGYSGNGKTCADIDECTTTDPNLKNKCVASSTCKNTVGSYTCTCNTGYSGSGKSKCNDIDECTTADVNLKDKCTQNCTNTIGSYTCNCATGFTLDVGDKLTCKATTPCTTNSGKGTCTVDANTACVQINSAETCVCVMDGYALNTAETKCEDIDECKLTGTDAKCKSDVNSVCKNTPGSYQCECKTGYDGIPKCRDIDECLNKKDNCDANAHCTNTDGSFKCTCKTGYTGDGVTCTDVDECKFPILAPYRCTQKCENKPVGSFNCSCETGFELQTDSFTCKAKAANVCGTGGQGPCTGDAKVIMCAKVANVETCFCKAGYALDPTTKKSCADIDECTSTDAKLKEQCHADATCINTPAGSYTCACKAGYSGDGMYTCDNIDECKNAKTSGCNQKPCDNTVGSFKCKCEPGFTMQEKTCKATTACSNGGMGPCIAGSLNRTMCANIGGVDKCFCRAGFKLDEDNKHCIVVNECSSATLNDCDKFAGRCTELILGYSCKCKAGYNGDGITCRDIDECAGMNNCHQTLATCLNTPGSFECKCNLGYTGDGRTCTDYDECKNPAMNKCSQKCNNTKGSYTCSCEDGFSLLQNDKFTCSAKLKCTTNSELGPCKSVPAGQVMCAKVGETGAPKCACNRGYSLQPDDLTCTEMSSCTTGSPCSQPPPSTMVPSCHVNKSPLTGETVPGGFTCGCEVGYRSDGLGYCEKMCPVSVKPCQNGATYTCTFATPFYKCQCTSGYTGTNCEIEINECMTEPCKNKGQCKNDPPGSYTCYCPKGFDPKTNCGDIDECKATGANKHNCLAGKAKCTNSVGSFSCTCNSPMVGNGVTVCTESVLLPFNTPAIKKMYGNNVQQDIPVTCGFPFGDEIYRNIKLCTNGYFSLEPAASNRANIILSQVSSTKDLRQMLIVAPFLTNIDIKKGDANGPTLYYDTYLDTETDANKKAVLDKINTIIRKFPTASTFAGKLVVVATWDKVSPIDGTAYKDETFTFQGALASNGTHSYAIFLYQPGSMKWDKDNNARIVFMGYESNKKLFTHLGSFLKTALGIDVMKGTNDTIGVWAYPIGSVKTNNYQKCCNWENTIDKVTRTATAVCPATLMQLILMDMMEKDKTSSGDCYIPYLKSGNDWQRCCYSKTGGGLLEGADCGYIRVDKKETTDNEGWKACCATDMCSMFHQHRPCSKMITLATPGSLGVCLGDPHIITHDNVTWTFNGLGEWIMVRTKVDKKEFQLQARTVLAPATSGFDPKATVFTGFAMKAKDTDIVEVSLNAAGDGLDILINKAAGPTMASLTTINRSKKNMVLENVAGTFVVRFLTSGFVFKVSHANKMLNMTLAVPSKYKKTSTEFLEGLMGNYDGRKSNEWQQPDTVAFDEGSTEKDFYNYGKTWNVPEADSLFNYVAPKTYASYQNLNFIPLFSHQYKDKASLLAEVYSNDQAMLASCNASCMNLWRTAEIERKAYYACMFDGGRLKNCKASSAFVAEFNIHSLDTNILENRAPSFANKPLILNAQVGTLATLAIKLSDPDTDDVVTLKVSGTALPGGAINDVAGNPMEKTYTWKPTDTKRYKLTLSATDKLQAETLIDVELHVCNCSKKDQCDYKEVIKTKTPDNFYLVDCKCPGDYKGRWCELSPCDYRVTPCYPGVTCSVDGQTNKAKCGACPTGMKDSTLKDPGKNCLDIDECLTTNPKPCEGDGVCKNTLGSYFCQCPAGRRPKIDNFKVCEDVDECLNPSLGKCDDAKNETCENLIGSYRCVCKKGYKKKSDECVDIDECTSTTNKHDCNVNAKCANTVGSFTCTCNTGYYGNGVTCADVDECLNPKDNDCDQKCTNTSGSYNCTCDKAGFKLHDDKRTCQVIDADKCTVKKTCAQWCTKVATTETCSCRSGYVADGDKCLVDDMCAKKTAKCTDTCTPDSKGGYTCSCKAGYKLDPDMFTCSDIDECQDGKNNCAKTADGGTCTNTIGSFTCKCATGYTGNGTHCNDTDECKTVKCQANSVCVNAPGTYKCICHPLYYEKTGSCLRAPQTWNGTITFGETYEPDLKNIAAKKTQDYTNVFAKTIEKPLKDQYGASVLGISVISLTSGSIKPQYVIHTDGNGNVSPTGLQGAVQTLVTKNPAGTCVMHMSDGTSKALDCTSNKIVDYNECAAGYDVHQCPHATQCVNEAGSYRCNCKPGYKVVQPNPVNHIQLCDDINECLTLCKLPLTNCTNTPGSYTCKCNLGYWSTNANKIPCKEACGPKPCQNGKCVGDITKDGGFRCVCPDHYQGKLCEVINAEYAEMRTIAIAVGCTVGALALILLIVLIVICVKRRRASNKNGQQGNGNDKTAVSLETYETGYLPRVQSRPASSASLTNDNIQNGNNRRRNNDDRASRSSNEGTDNPAFENPLFDNRQRRNNQDDKSYF